MNPSNLLFITTSSLAANPRLVKEFEALKNDFKCCVISFKHHDWTLELSEAIKARNPEVQFIELDRSNKVLQTIGCKILHKSAILLNGLFSKSFKIAAFASNDKAPQLWLVSKRKLKTTTFTRVIAHNLGAFYAAVKTSDKTGIALQLDIEDYYPGEALYFNKAYEEQNRMRIMAHSFQKADSITYASEGIKMECQKHFKVDDEANEMTIVNAFNAVDFKKPQPKVGSKIKCVWFSQHIGPNRGLEKVFEAAKTMDTVEFHFVGNRNEAYLNAIELSNNVILHDIMNQEELHDFLSQMDIGLALENGNADYNRDICLTNKFLAYLQSGLYILATNTFGQSHFLESLTYNAGVIMKSSLADSLLEINLDVLSIDNKLQRWQSAKLFSWENEQLKLKKLIQ
ncbi:hypothetical protein HNV08_12250 [Winogradskyella eckloniae]|uniref:hypothetical protein n=1 Tax=Winogradskyella eckloniae TaxID=1089306 RepID=UPI0015630860|nr:hypothetical protein [Winogradskyella eckloniae]NRD20819.1 hypothetical protein [Winogradskyella eckloniae]